MNQRLRTPAAAAAALVLLAACGGGSDDSPAVTNLTATPVMYGKTLTLTVSGAGLDSTVTAVIEPGCLSMTRGTTTASSMTFTCKPQAVGDLRVRVRAAGGAELATLRLDVPTPQVRVGVTQGTQSGNFVIELDPQRAPIAVQNFLDYVNLTAPFYRNTIFHRIESTSAVYGGVYTNGPAVKSSGQRAPVAGESGNGLKNVRGTIAMVPEDATGAVRNGFLINVADNPALDHVSATQPGHTVFGTVIERMDIVDLIAAVETTSKTVTIADQQVTFPKLPTSNVTISAIVQIR